MLSALAFAALASAAYTVTEFAPPAGADVLSRNVLLEDGTVICSWADSRGVHGETFPEKIVAYAKGKEPISLPMPEGEYAYAQIHSGRGDDVIGFVSEDGGSLPCLWRRTGGRWERTTLSAEPGLAWFIDKKGGIWNSAPAAYVRWSENGERRVPQKQDDLVFVDEQGRLFVNHYDSLGQGFSRLGRQAVVIEGTSRKTLLPDGCKSFVIEDGNDAGDLVGYGIVDSEKYERRAYMWSKGEFTLLAPGTSFTTLKINNNRLIAGSRDWRIVVFRGGVAAEPDIPELKEVTSILDEVNDAGQILVHTNSPDRVFLLTPGL